MIPIPDSIFARIYGAAPITIYRARRAGIDLLDAPAAVAWFNRPRRRATAGTPAELAAVEAALALLTRTPPPRPKKATGPSVAIAAFAEAMRPPTEEERAAILNQPKQ